jgi:hypothetical protein
VSPPTIPHAPLHHGYWYLEIKEQSTTASSTRHPGIDQACVRDLGLIVSDGGDFCSEEKRDTDTQVHYLEDGVPALRLVNTCREARYRIEKDTVTDSARAAVLHSVRFVPLRDEPSTYRLHVLLALHLGNQGTGKSAGVDEFDGTPLQLARRAGIALTLGCSTGLVEAVGRLRGALRGLAGPEVIQDDDMGTPGPIMGTSPGPARSS